MRLVVGGVRRAKGGGWIGWLFLRGGREGVWVWEVGRGCDIMVRVGWGGRKGDDVGYA